MENEIADLVYVYSNGNKDIDFEFVNQIVVIAKKYYCLDDYIKKTIIYNGGFQNLAEYAISKKELCFYFEAMNIELSSLANEFECTSQSILFKYLYSVKVILHEIEHAYQHKKVKELNNIEGEILKAEYCPIYNIMETKTLLQIVKLIKMSNLRKKYYNLSPSERLAEINACETSQKVSLLLEEEMCYDVVDYYRLNKILSGYSVKSEFSNIPTKTYLEKVNPNYDYSNVVNLSKILSSEELMRYGLESSYDEIKNTESKINVLKNKIKYYNY